MNKYLKALIMDETEYPEDVALLKEKVPGMKRFTNREVAALWEDYSNDGCAGWLDVNDSQLNEFTEWLE